MTSKEFLKALANGEADIVELLLYILQETDSAYCLIGGLAVNAYVEPVVSLDLDLVVVAANVEEICRRAEEYGLSVERFSHSVNLTSPKSDLRIQIQTDPRYQKYLANASKKSVLGYELFVADKEDVIQGKIWAYQDETRRKSKRQKDLADILRLVESYPALKANLPDSIAEHLD
jgi:hypothetical protein